MSLLGALLLIGAIVAAAGVALALLWRTVREHATVRRTLDVVMLQVLLPKDLSREEREEGERRCGLRQFESHMLPPPRRSSFNDLPNGDRSATCRPAEPCTPRAAACPPGAGSSSHR